MSTRFGRFAFDEASRELTSGGRRIPLSPKAFELLAVLLRESLTPLGNVDTELVLFLLLAVVPQIGGHTLYNWSLRWVTAPVVSLSLVGEPIGSSLLAWAILTQVPSPGVAVGALLALFGIYLTVYGQGAQTRAVLAARDVE